LAYKAKVEKAKSKPNQTPIPLYFRLLGSWDS
jgi:hypothetical protein